MQIRWYVPDFMDFPVPEPTSFENEDELLRIVRLRELMAEPYFDHWEVSNHDDVESSLLMMITKTGEWWVIGYLPRHHGLSFPVWTADRRKNDTLPKV